MSLPRPLRRSDADAWALTSHLRRRHAPPRRRYRATVKPSLVAPNNLARFVWLIAGALAHYSSAESLEYNASGRPVIPRWKSCRQVAQRRPAPARIGTGDQPRASSTQAELRVSFLPIAGAGSAIPLAVARRSVQAPPDRGDRGRAILAPPSKSNHSDGESPSLLIPSPNEVSFPTCPSRDRSAALERPNR